MKYKKIIDLPDRQKLEYEDLAERGEDILVLKKAIKQLLDMIVSHGETTIAADTAVGKGEAIKFEKIDFVDCGETYSKYHLTVEFFPKYPPFTDFGTAEKTELGRLDKMPNTKMTTEQMKRFEFLKNLQKAYYDRLKWNRFVENIGARKVRVSYELGNEKNV